MLNLGRLRQRVLWRGVEATILWMDVRADAGADRSIAAIEGAYGDTQFMNEDCVLEKEEKEDKQGKPEMD